jgi:hypothetical protein
MRKKLMALIDGWGLLTKSVVVLGGLVAIVLGLNQAWMFIRDAPAVVSANAEHVDMHHDSIGDLYSAVEAQQTVAQHVDEHLTRYDSANAERDRKLDYLVCLRIERKRELDSLPPLRDCDAELLR